MPETNRAPMPGTPAPDTIEKGGLVASIASVIRDWRERRRLAVELGEMAASGDLDPFLADAGINRALLPSLLRTSGGTRRLLQTMAARVGVDLAALPASLRREVEWSCAACGETKACGRWLRNRTPAGYAPFCPNTPAVRRLVRVAADSECGIKGV
jgi:uncharacterized protein YjiS (DUF1127 family)